MTDASSTATFANSGQLVEGRTPVRVHGVEVGTVEQVEPGATSATSDVTLRIDDHAYVELARDASARIRYRSILGGSRFVELDPGSPSAPPLGDRPIPLEPHQLPGHLGPLQRAVRTRHAHCPAAAARGVPPGSGCRAADGAHARGARTDALDGRRLGPGRPRQRGRGTPSDVDCQRVHARGPRTGGGERCVRSSAEPSARSAPLPDAEKSLASWWSSRLRP